MVIFSLLDLRYIHAPCIFEYYQKREKYISKSTQNATKTHQKETKNRSECDRYIEESNWNLVYPHDIYAVEFPITPNFLLERKQREKKAKKSSTPMGMIIQEALFLLSCIYILLRSYSAGSYDISFSSNINAIFSTIKLLYIYGQRNFLFYSLRFNLCETF